MVTKNPHYILSPAGSKKKKVSAHGLSIIRAGLVEGLYLTPNNVGQKGLTDSKNAISIKFLHKL